MANPKWRLWCQIYCCKVKSISPHIAYNSPPGTTSSGVGFPIAGHNKGRVTFLVWGPIPFYWQCHSIGMDTQQSKTPQTIGLQQNRRNSEQQRPGPVKAYSTRTQCTRWCFTWHNSIRWQMKKRTRALTPAERTMAPSWTRVKSRRSWKGIKKKRKRSRSSFSYAKCHKRWHILQLEEACARNGMGA